MTMNTNDVLPTTPDMYGYGNSNNSFFNYQTQSIEDAEVNDYIRITNNRNPLTVELLLKGQGFGFSDEDRQRFKELYLKYGYGEVKEDNQSSTKQEDNLSGWDQEEIKAMETDEGGIEVPDAPPEEKEIKGKEKESKKTKRIQSEKQSYSEYDQKMQEQGKRGFDFMYERESGFLRLRDEALDKLLTEKFNVGAIKAYLYIWKMAYKHKFNSLHWTASANEIAEELNLSRGTVSSGLDQLEERGLIKIEPARHERSSYTYIIQPIT
jgi:DNA-binding MarR family transcriptional regulator